MTTARKLFGTDGVRGKANVYPMSAEMAMKIGISAGAEFTRGKKGFFGMQDLFNF